MVDGIFRATIETVFSKQRLRTFACCAILEMAALIGVPMRPEQVQDLMRTLNEPKIARTNPDDSNRGDKVRTHRYRHRPAEKT